jgi:transcriptional regulator with XRE-family HTH domain
VNWDQTRAALATLRTRRGLSQRELATRMGVAQSMVSDWEYGRINNPRMPSLVAWAEMLHVRIDIKIRAGTVEFTVTDLQTGQPCQ